jgi:hypothetical protein
MRRPRPTGGKKKKKKQVLQRTYLVTGTPLQLALHYNWHSITTQYSAALSAKYEGPYQRFTSYIFHDI